MFNRAILYDSSLTHKQLQKCNSMLTALDGRGHHIFDAIIAENDQESLLLTATSRPLEETTVIILMHNIDAELHRKLLAIPTCIVLGNVNIPQHLLLCMKIGGRHDLLVERAVFKPASLSALFEKSSASWFLTYNNFGSALNGFSLIDKNSKIDVGNNVFLPFFTVADCHSLKDFCNTARLITMDLATSMGPRIIYESTFRMSVTYDTHTHSANFKIRDPDTSSSKYDDARFRSYLRLLTTTGYGICTFLTLNLPQLYNFSGGYSRLLGIHGTAVPLRLSELCIEETFQQSYFYRYNLLEGISGILGAAGY